MLTRVLRWLHGRALAEHREPAWPLRCVAAGCRDAAAPFMCPDGQVRFLCDDCADWHVRLREWS